jgi:hypothetical protein
MVMVTLSVSRTKRGSSVWTFSPSAFSHSVRTPSVMDSPTAGTVTGVLMRDRSFLKVAEGGE